MTVEQASHQQIPNSLIIRVSCLLLITPIFGRVESDVTEFTINQFHTRYSRTEGEFSYSSP